MFSLNEYISYYLYPRYIDMNKGIECLSELIRSQMNANPLSGDAFLFFGKKKTWSKYFAGIPINLFYIKNDWKKVLLNYPVLSLLKGCVSLNGRSFL